MPTRNVMKTLLAVALCASFGASGVSAASASSALDQYVEEVPNTDGNRTPPTGNGQKGTIDPNRAKQLSSMGEDGAALLEVAESTSPATSNPPPTADGALREAALAEGSIGSEKRETIGDRTPSTTNSISAAAIATGFSVPLLVFGLALVAAMGVAAWFRRRGEPS